MPVIKFYTYAMNSKGMKELKKELRNRGHNVLALKKNLSTYRYREGHFIINWGSGRELSMLIEPCPSSNFLNKDPHIIRKASNKLSCFRKIQEAGNIHILPRFTNDKEEAKGFFNEADKVYCRTELDSSQGRGIVVADNVDNLVDAPLYTASVPCQREFRVHVMAGNVIDVVMKKKMRDERMEEEGIVHNPDIRSHGNGYVFARQDINVPDNVKEAALLSISSLGLDFGAVDIVLDSYGNAKVLEINTAPGITGSTTIAYASAIEGWMSCR